LDQLIPGIADAGKVGASTLERTKAVSGTGFMKEMFVG
jgi:hypothetical protein